MFICQRCFVFVTLSDKSLFELLTVVIEVIWCSADPFDSKRSTIYDVLNLCEGISGDQCFSDRFL